MSAGLARSWWAIGLRGIATLLFGIAVLILPSPSIASLVLLFAAYVAADGAFAMLAGWRATSQTERLWTLILEGATNLAVAATVLVWAALAAVPLISLASGWAIVTGALVLAAAHRRSPVGRAAGSWGFPAGCRPAGACSPSPWRRPRVAI